MRARGAIELLVVLGAAIGGARPTAAMAPPPPGPSASAAPRVAVSVVPADGTETFIAGELRFLGLDPHPVVLAQEPDFDTMQQLARDGQFAAVLYVDRQRAQVHVSVLDRMTGKMSSRRLDASQELAPRDVAVRAVELLRASLLELTAEAPPPEREVVAPPELARTLAPRPRWGLALGASVAGAPGGLTPSVALRLAWSIMPHRMVGIAVTGMAPVMPARVAAEEGEADVHIGWFTVGPRFALAPEQRFVRPALLVGLGPAFFGMVGRADEPYRSGRALVVTGIAEAELDLDFVLSSHWRIRMAGSVGVCMTRPEVVFAGRRAGSWCLPFGVGQLGVAVEW